MSDTKCFCIDREKELKDKIAKLEKVVEAAKLVHVNTHTHNRHLTMVKISGVELLLEALSNYEASKGE